MVLIDPSYQDKRDYRRAFNAVKEGVKRFATGTYAVWYPLVQRVEAGEPKS
jgi:23S rRNA (adenine2030-N6)-methyltransferase